jgi:hypothetical protein
MAHARNHNNVENNNATSPPPPPPPNLEQVLAMQAQMLQIMVNTQNAQHQASSPPLRDRLGDFQCTKPPTFSHVVESIDTDDWLKSMEKRLQVVQCNNCENVMQACQQLLGPAADWWDAYVEAHVEYERINWPEFRATFRVHHVSQGVIKLKKKVFQVLK